MDWKMYPEIGVLHLFRYFVDVFLGRSAECCDCGQDGSDGGAESVHIRINSLTAQI